ncbi:MAG TPA: Asp-tRNA(Asn)/Glu-tRNA(Gln) amidotransferase subunit GatC [Candidatus Saccharimonadales bacterium]|nr:Asp-tRNA(Asn)/Glu-tRNA(Gln) amidotransferase subunit GatC [Candidatus Saccharimonadales bacterium]
MTKLSTDDIVKLAHLARLDISNEEIAEYREELSEILAYVEQLQTVAIDGLSTTNQVTGLVNVTRDDEIRSYGYEPHELLKNVANVIDDQIQVRRILG